MRGFLLAALAAGLSAGCSSTRPELFVYTWADYLAPDTASTFETEAGVRVTVRHFESGAEMRAALTGGRSGFDVVVASDEDVAVLSRAGLLEPLDPALLPNLKNLHERFRGGTAIAVPYMWGTTGIAVNSEKIPAPVDSWAALWDPKHKPMSMLEDGPEAFAAAMRLDGASILKADDAAIAKAKERLVAQKAHLLPYTSQPREDLVKGTNWLAQCFSGDALQAAQENPAIRFIRPREGATVWVDHLVIPKGVKDRKLAHDFLNYILRAEVSAKIANHVRYANCNEAARAHTDAGVLNNPIAYPPEEELKRCERFQDLDPEVRRKVEDAWAEVRRT